MNPQDALNLLDSIVQQVNMSRAQHIKAQQAVTTLQSAIEPNTKPKEPTTAVSGNTRSKS